VSDATLFFDGWDPVLRTAILTPLAYAGMVLFLRVSGKRTLAQLNVFDWVVTVALGSALATVVVSPNVALLPGLLGIGGLIGMQYLVSLLTSRWEGARRLVTAEPVLIIRDGELLRGAMRRERIAESEVLQALRKSGKATPGEVRAVILETNGSFTVLGDAAADAAAVPDSDGAR
jgi:uncharacterized membrane protein YcaP (DUF421 family)